MVETTSVFISLDPFKLFLDIFFFLLVLTSPYLTTDQFDPSPSGRALSLALPLPFQALFLYFLELMFQFRSVHSEFSLTTLQSDFSPSPSWGVVFVLTPFSKMRFLVFRAHNSKTRPPLLFPPPLAALSNPKEVARYPRPPPSLLICWEASLVREGDSR